MSLNKINILQLLFTSSYLKYCFPLCPVEIEFYLRRERKEQKRIKWKATLASKRRTSSAKGRNNFRFLKQWSPSFSGQVVEITGSDSPGRESVSVEQSHMYISNMWPTWLPHTQWDIILSQREYSSLFRFYKGYQDARQRNTFQSPSQSVNIYL